MKRSKAFPTYLKENHSRFEEILEEQSKLAKKYPVIVPFLNGEESMEVTAEEHKAIIEYLNLREKTELLIREYHYYLGQAMNIPGLQEFGIHRNGKWKDSTHSPSAGTIIFFDWDGDGISDHVGIVEKCENGRVYTVEGNSGDAVRQEIYLVESRSILGYGLLF